jgi:hypothetical protein
MIVIVGEFIVAAVLVAILATQVLIPMVQGKPLFPAFNKRRVAALKRAADARAKLEAEALEWAAEKEEQRLKASQTEVAEAIQSRFNKPE